MSRTVGAYSLTASGIGKTARWPYLTSKRAVCSVGDCHIGAVHGRDAAKKARSPYIASSSYVSKHTSKPE